MQPVSTTLEDNMLSPKVPEATELPKTYLDELPYYSSYQLAENEVPLARYLLPSDPSEVQRGVEHGRFPTLTNLARLQRQLGQPPNPSSDKANESPPAPFPPRRTKAELLGSTDFSATDEFARSVTLQPSDDWERLAQRLFEQSRSNLDKVRAAFCFVCTHRDLPEADGESPAYRAIRLRSQEILFETILNCGNVPNKKIYGYKKAIGYESGLKASFGGHWFACYVEGEWRFVDPHWGAIAVQNYDSGRYGAIDDKGRVGSARERKGQNVFHCDEFWFLTDPEKMIVSHCPPQDLLDWQLLARPVTIEEFELMPRYFSGTAKEIEFFQLEPINYPKNVIVSKPGPIEILLKETGGQQYMYSRELKIHKKHISDESKTAILSAYQQKACVSKEIRVSDNTVKFLFEPPCPGQYALSIALWRHVSETHLTGCNFVTYTVHCPQIWESADVIPEGNTALDEFGPGRNLRQVGLTSKESGKLKAEDGEVALEITSLVKDEGSNNKRNLTCQALGPDNQPLPAGSVLVWRDESRNAFLFLAPDSGYYALVLYERGRPVGQFLVDASSEAKDGGSFPMPDWDRVGGLGFATDAASRGRRLIPLSHPTPYVRTEESDLTIQFGFEGSGNERGIELRAEMLVVGADSSTEPLTDFCLMSGIEEGGYEVRCRFPRAGHYLLRLTSREGGGDWRLFYTYFVRAVGQLDGSAAAFPRLAHDWPAGGALLEPLDRTLPVGLPTPFRIRLGDSTATAIDGVEVVDERSGHREALSRDPADQRLWVGSVTAQGGDSADAEDDKSGGVTVVARLEGGTEVELVKLDIESKASAEAKAAALREAESLNERREALEENRKRKQDNRNRRDQGLEPLLIKTYAEVIADVEANSAAALAKVAARRKALALASSAANAAAEANAALKSAVAAASGVKALARAVPKYVAQAQAAAKSAAMAESATIAAAEVEEISKSAEGARMTAKASAQAETSAKAATLATSQIEAILGIASEAETKTKLAAEAAANAATSSAFEAEAADSAEADVAVKSAAASSEEAEASARAVAEIVVKVTTEFGVASKGSEMAAAAAEAAAKSAADANAAAKEASEMVAAEKAETKMLIAQLDAALLERSLARLRKTIQLLRRHEVKLRGTSLKKYQEAQLTLTALQHRKDLRDAMAEAQRSRNSQRLRTLVQRLEDEAEREPLTEAQLALFREDLRLAREAIQRDDRLERMPQHRLEMNPKSLTELRQYSRPVEAVHKTVQALLLLLGNYEKRTRKWPRCQPLLKNITKLVADFQPRLVDPRIAARSREILDGIDKREIALQSAAAFSFYEWAVKTTDSIKEVCTSDDFMPAKMAQQRCILGVTVEEDAELNFQDEGTRK